MDINRWNGRNRRLIEARAWVEINLGSLFLKGGLIFMNNKRGRPKSFLTKTDRLEVRLSKEQVYWLNYLINKSGKSKSQIVAEAIKKLYDENK